MKYKLLAIGTSMVSLLATAVGEAQNRSVTPNALGNQGNINNNIQPQTPSQPEPWGRRPVQQNDNDNPRPGQYGQRMLQRFDTNHNGILDDNEKAQMRASIQQRRLMKQDSEPGGAGEGPTMVERGLSIDRGVPGNNPINSGVNNRPWGVNPTDQAREQFGQRMLNRFDTNHDGILDENEKSQMRTFMQELRERRQANPGNLPPRTQPN